MIHTCPQHPRRRTRLGFTLVELLVVIGIIAILVGILLPTLNNVRKAGYKAKCLANLKTLGDVYKMYQLENRGYWPAAWQQYKRTIPPGPIGATADKRWHDFIGRLTVGGMIGKQELNWNGTQNKSLEPQIWTEPIWHSDNVIWGCPVWDRVGRDQNGVPTAVDDATTVYFPGYLQNWYPQLPEKATRSIKLDANDPVPGGFFKYTQYNRQAERALLFESISHNWGAPTTWPYKPDNPGGADFPKVPSGGVTNFPIDFNRHGRYEIGNKANDPSLNVLFCDGHATTVSCREAWKAIRFN